MYIIDLQIKNIKFKRCINTNDINICVQHIPLILKDISEIYCIEFDSKKDVKINKIKWYQ